VYLTKHPVFQKAPPTISEVKHQSAADVILITAKITGNEDKNGDRQPAYLVYKNANNGVWQLVELLDDGGHKDMATNDSVYTATIKKVSGTKYYIIAEGERMAALSPERASYEFYEVD
ncbi:MAG: hypothetical protein AAGJ18_09945, partial [Bacteroidota bacterium]